MGNRWETGRTEAFSDGVFAIAITLPILEVAVPESALRADRADGGLARRAVPRRPFDKGGAGARGEPGAAAAEVAAQRDDAELLFGPHRPPADTTLSAAAAPAGPEDVGVRPAGT
jgi:hypothetical protein